MALEALRRVVRSIPQVEVAWVAKDGEEAVARCLNDTPDLILMDMIMPVMDGVEATRLIMRQCPCPILVVTATVTGNAARVYEALGHGALDAVNTPVLGVDSDLAGAHDLVRKIRMVARLTGVTEFAPDAAPQAPPIAPPNKLRQALPMVAIGASTGGPQALVEVLVGLPLQRPFAVVVVQHVDALFAPGLAQWLSTETRRPVTVIESGQRLAEAAIGVAATNDHLILDRHGRLRYVREPADQVHRPSVDVFFHSLLTAPVPPGAAVLLTGMGRDGAVGLKALRAAGWRTIVQDEATSVIWGMPGAAARLDAADHILPIDAIAARIRSAMPNAASAAKEAGR
jgi:two-component system response regulator WspF